MQLAATRVGYELMMPPEDLAGYIRFYWNVNSLPNNGDHYIFRTMASGSPVVFFHYRGNVQEAPFNRDPGQSYKTAIYGSTEDNNRFRLSKDFGIFGVCLYPFAVPVLFKLPSSEIANQVLSLQELMGPEANELEEKVLLCNSNAARAEQVSDFLRAKLMAAKDAANEFSRAVTAVIHSRGNVRIPALADDYCLSRRTFERRFRESSGLSPKSYANVIRFQSAFDELTAGKSTLTEVAYQCGYYDQSHFTNDFKRFSGFNPKSFTTNDPCSDPLWLDFVAFFQFLSWCPPVLCFRKGTLKT
jgi:AraC-like DNA-binding protein